jgi:hypothetical protein
MLMLPAISIESNWTKGWKAMQKERCSDLGLHHRRNNDCIDTGQSGDRNQGPAVVPYLELSTVGTFLVAGNEGYDIVAIYPFISGQAQKRALGAPEFEDRAGQYDSGPTVRHRQQGDRLAFR